MADDEMENFEITDYDLQNEFTGHHSRRKMTKEQQIYGMWADHSDGDEGEAPIKMTAKHALKKGMSFVAGGVQQSGKKNKNNEAKENSPVQEGNQNISYNSSDEEQMGRPSIGFKTSLPTQKKYKKSNTTYKEGGIGEWERHTTGIGSKLMKQMGYKEGQGLGKNLQGRSTPVEANKRRGKGAIGFYGDERSKGRAEPDSEEEEKTKFEEQLQQWRKTGSRRKVKYIYKSAEEAIQEGKTKGTKRAADTTITKTKVIDMTGPETRVLSSYNAIAGQKPILNDYEEMQNRSYEHFNLSELIHNVQLLVEQSEENIVKNAKDLEKAENRMVHLNHERERYDSLLEREQKDMDMMDGASEILTELEELHKESKMTLDNAQRLFSEFKSSYSQVYNSYEIAYLAPTYITNLFRARLSTWQPLKEPCLHVEEFTKWQQLIELDTNSSMVAPGPGDKMDPYHQIVWHCWTTVVRTNILNTWNPKDTEDILKFLEMWSPPLIPNWIKTHLLGTVIMPRISEAVSSWSPSVDRVPIEKWIHPWIPLLSDQLQTIYPVIRQKLSSALTMWHPSDQSAKLVLEPWKNVFSEISMTTLIQTHIQPKLERALLEVPISPNHQILDAWYWFANWQDMLPTQIIVQVLEKCFFPQWYQALGIWLSAKPPFSDVVAWYKGWRDVIPAKAHTHFQVRQKFQQYLEISRRALSYQPGAADQFSLLLSGLENISAPPPPPPLGSPPKPKDWARIIGSARRENASVKDLVENKCQEQGILFIPLVERRHEGRPVYRCGSQTISFNKNIIYVHTERGWVPRSMSVVLNDA